MIIDAVNPLVFPLHENDDIKNIYIILKCDKKGQKNIK